MSGILLCMKLDDIEEHAPNGPNFGLIVRLFCATILVFFIIALLYMHFGGHDWHFLRHHPNPNASLILPASLNA